MPGCLLALSVGSGTLLLFHSLLSSSLLVLCLSSACGMIGVLRKKLQTSQAQVGGNPGEGSGPAADLLHRGLLAKPG